MLGLWRCGLVVLVFAPLGLAEELRLPLAPALRRTTNSSAPKKYYPKTFLAKYLPHRAKAKKAIGTPTNFPLNSVYTTTLELGSPPRKFTFAIHPYAMGFSLLAKVAEASCPQPTGHFCTCSATCKVVQESLMVADEISDKGQVITDSVQFGLRTWMDFPLQLLTDTKHPLFDMYSVDGYIGLQPFDNGSVLPGSFIHFLSMKGKFPVAIHYEWARQGHAMDLIIDTQHAAHTMDPAQQLVPQGRMSFFFGLGLVTSLAAGQSSADMIVVPQLPTFVSFESQATLLPVALATQLHHQLLQLSDGAQPPLLRNDGYFELDCSRKYSPLTLLIGKLEFKFTFPNDFVRIGPACYSPFAAMQSSHDALKRTFGFVDSYGNAVGLGQHFLRKNPITMIYGSRHQGSAVFVWPFGPMRADGLP
ncbi:hypothetical protein H4R35_006167 [Dimargaris xerosporica]|nr:hypothetical protein H4R35_006167 [Dimargaris xerosporica]